MKQKQLEIKLQQVKTFNKPKLELEQYPTPANIAAAVIHCIFNEGDIEGLRVVDLGAGPGILSIGATLMGASHVSCVELDKDALTVLKENLDLFELGEDCVEIVCMDVGDFKCEDCDVVIMNPPFGTKNNKGF